MIESSGEEIFKARLRDILHRDRHALTHGLIASLQPPLAITTNYDKGYELAARAVNNEVATVLPWDSPASNRSARILKLHGDLDLGQIVLSRDQFVSMNAFRRPLSGILQERMMIGHVLAVGTSMSDATLVHAAEEVRALVSRTPSGTRRGKSGTIIFTEPDPARARLMKDTFEIADAGERGDLTVTLEAARNVDLLLDWLAMQSSSELSFVLDERYRSLLTTTDRRVAALIEAFREGYRATAGADVSELDRAVTAFLTSVGAPEPKG